MIAIRAALAAALLTATGGLPVWAAEPGGAGPLVSTDWVQGALGRHDVVVLDIRDAGTDAYGQAHIPGAVYSDYATDGWRVEQDGVPGMLPPVADLERLIGGLGIDNDDHVVVAPAGSGSSELGAATRVYWTFKVLGHDAVSILDGGYAAWTEEGRPLETEAVAPEPADFTADFRPELLASAADVRAAIGNGTTLIDARPVEQYLGLAQHPKAQTAGTLPGAVNTPQEALATIDGTRMRDAETLHYLFAQAGVDASAPAIAFCNTGHWASLAWFARSELLGVETRLYDGSMVEWTTDAGNPVATPTTVE